MFIIVRTRPLFTNPITNRFSYDFNENWHVLIIININSQNPTI